MKLPRLSLAAAIAAITLLSAHVSLADDLKALEGKWKVEKAEANGQVIESETLSGMLVTILPGGRYEVVVGDKKDAGTLKLDETQTPKTMDATDTEGEDVGNVVKAIYELKEDTLRVCYAIDGSVRPTEFVTKPESSLLLITYKREK